ncbi:MAG: septal ring lytic transglycosylase RlpA family protein [Egibacteraceae bacterium]
MLRHAAVLAAGVALTGMLIVSAAAQTVQRTQGHDRIATAVAVSQTYWETADQAVLATADTFADAVASTALAARVEGPILLTARDRLPAAVAAELGRLGVTKVWVVGGEHAVSSAVAAQLADAGQDVTRLAGEHRYATARRAAVAAGASMTGEVVVAPGRHPVADRSWPDALAAGALAGGPDRIPVLLTRFDRLSPDVERGLRDLGATRVLIAGGTGSLSPAVERRLRDVGYPVERVAGRSRYLTSAAFAERALDRMPDGAGPLVMASGEAFPDALVAAPLAAAVEGLVLLVPGEALNPGTDQWLRDHRDRLSGAVTVGGSEAVEDLVVQQVAAALQGAPRPEPPPPPPPSPVVVGAFEGQASWYGGAFAGRTTACGEPFDPGARTAAHPSLPCNTNVRVTNLHNGAQVTVRINDRGPYIDGRVIDLSEHAAAVLGFRGAGLAPVRGEVLASHGATAASASDASGPGVTHPSRGGR